MERRGFGGVQRWSRWTALALGLVAAAGRAEPPRFLGGDTPRLDLFSPSPAAPEPRRGKHPASYGRAYDRSYAKRHGERIVTAWRSTIAAWQQIEDERAAAVGRRPRSIEQEVRGGMFAMMPPWEEVFPDGGAFRTRMPTCCNGRSWVGKGPGGVERAIAEWRESGRAGGAVARRLDAEVRACIREICGDPIPVRSPAGQRRLSPVELEASKRAYAVITARSGGPPFPRLSPERFATALDARNEWFPAPRYRPDPVSLHRARWILASQLDLVGLPEDERMAALERFDDCVNVLPDRPPMEILATLSTRDRLVERAQRLENETAVCEGRVARDIAWAMERGRVVRPEPGDGRVDDVGALLDDEGADGGDRAFRPTPDEACEEIVALREVLREWPVADLVEDVVALRRAAWGAAED